MKRIQQKATYALIIASMARAAAAKLPKVERKREGVFGGTSVLSIGTFLKKKHGETHQYVYRQLPGSRTIIKELVA